MLGSETPPGSVTQIKQSSSRLGTVTRVQEPHRLGTVTRVQGPHILGTATGVQEPHRLDILTGVQEPQVLSLLFLADELVLQVHMLHSFGSEDGKAQSRKHDKKDGKTGQAEAACDHSCPGRWSLLHPGSVRVIMKPP